MTPPSSDQDVIRSCQGNVSLRAKPPLADTTRMSDVASSLLKNAMRPPSSDHEGSVSNSKVCGSYSTSVPSARMVQMSEEPPRLLANAIRVPSGDQEGRRSCVESESG